MCGSLPVNLLISNVLLVNLSDPVPSRYFWLAEMIAGPGRVYPDEPRVLSRCFPKLHWLLPTFPSASMSQRESEVLDGAQDATDHCFRASALIS